MCINTLYHYGCWYKSFRNTANSKGCRVKSLTHDTLLVHKYLIKDCSDCIAREPGNFKGSSVERIRSGAFAGVDHSLVNEIRYWYQFHLFSGHTCVALYHCYGQEADLYFAYPRK